MSELEWLQYVSLADGFQTLRPALIFAGSVAVFGLVIFHLHRFMARRDHFLVTVPGLRRPRRPLLIPLYYLLYVVRYGLFLPVFVYLWFWVLVGVLAFLYNTKEPEELLLMAMAVLTTIRVTSYYNEDLSRDIAKILPYGLLGIFLVNLGRIDFEASLSLLERFGPKGYDAVYYKAFYYWVYVVSQELVLRVSYSPIMAANSWIKTNYHSVQTLLSERQNDIRDNEREE